MLSSTGRGYSKHVLLPAGSLVDTTAQVQITEISPGEKVAGHRHLSQTEVICGLTGVCTFVFDVHEVSLGPEDVLIIQPGDLHGARNDGREACRFLTVKLNYSIDKDDTQWG